MLFGSISEWVVMPGRTSVGRQAMSRKGWAMGPINSVSPVARFRTGRIRRAAVVKRNRPG